MYNKHSFIEVLTLLVYMKSLYNIMQSLLKFNQSLTFNTTGEGSAHLLHSLKFRHAEQQGLFNILIKLLILNILTSCSN